MDSVADVITVPSSSLAPPPKSLTMEADARFLTGICKLKEELILLVDLPKIVSGEDFGQITELDQDINKRGV